MKRAIFPILVFILMPVEHFASAVDGDGTTIQAPLGPRAFTKSEQRPDLSKIRSPQLTQALTDPEAFWEFITAPETEYSNRMAAAVQGVAVFPLRWLPRLLAAQAELAKERGLHGWGLKRDPFSAMPLLKLPLDSYLAKDLPRQRQVLGHGWVVPEEAIAFPLSWNEASMAPWPWQVQQALGQFYYSLRPDYYRRLSQGPAWLEETMKLPWGTDEEARTFVRLSNDSSHYKTMAVMARWRKISLDPSKPNAARDVAVNLRSAVGLWNDPVSQTVGQVILTDIVRSGPHESARQQVAYWLGEQRNAWRDLQNLRMPLPVTSVLAVSEGAVDPAHGDQWTRLYYYATGVCKALDSRQRDSGNGLMEGKFVSGINWNHPPFDPTLVNQMDPQAPKVGELLKKFERWFHRNEAKLRKEAAKESSEIGRVRGELVALQP